MLGFWAVAGGMVLALAALFLRALTQPQEAGAPGTPDVKVYRDQLAEVDRDQARGVLAPEEAQRLKTEVSRRLLEADRAARHAAPAGRSLPVLPVAGVVALALAGGVWLYAELGVPGYADQPLADRLAMADEFYRTRPSQQQAEAQAPAAAPQPPADPAFLELMDKLRSTLAERPDDVRGLELLARNESALGNAQAAARAQEHLVAVLGDAVTPGQRLDLAQYLIVAAGGYVSPQAEAQLGDVLRAEPANGLARYYVGLMFAQVGRPDRTFELWEPLLRQSPPEAPWLQPIQAGIEEIAARAGIRYTPPELRGPTAEDVQATAEMTPEDRQAMIEGMVAGLEGRLMDQGGTEAEWLQLFGALAVLGAPDRVQAALAKAEADFAAEPATLDRIRAAAAQAAP